MINSSAITARINQRAVLFAAAFGILAAVAATPVLAADAANGKRVAVRWCAACHVVTFDQRRPAPRLRGCAALQGNRQSGEFQ
jgi:cytochrome c2